MTFFVSRVSAAPQRPERKLGPELWRTSGGAQRWLWHCFGFGSLRSQSRLSCLAFQAARGQEM